MEVWTHLRDNVLMSALPRAPTTERDIVHVLVGTRDVSQRLYKPICDRV